MNYYIADTHFGHENVIKFSKRPFGDVEEMDKFIMDAWNEVVGKDDDIYILGDLVYRSNKSYSYYLSKLSGKKHLIVGNHDRAMLKDKEAMSYFESVDDLTMIHDDGIKIVLCHYPLLEWSGFYRNSYHIHGHIHNIHNEAFATLRNMERALNAGAEIINYTPCSFKELMKYNEIFKIGGIKA